MKASEGDSAISAVDLFCGVGGLSYGLTQAGIAVAAGFDIDPDCRYPYIENNGGAFVEADVALTRPEEIGSHLDSRKITLVAGCAPCQPFSTYSQSGRAKRANSDWRLLVRFGQIIESIQPDLVAMENVPQVATHPGFRTFLKYLTGYHLRWSTVECSYLGIPQTRKRLVLLASRLGEANLQLTQIDAPPRTVRDTIANLPALEAGQADPYDRLHVACSLSKQNLRRIRASKPGGTWRDWPASLRAACHRRPSGTTYPSVYGRMEWDTVAPTITTQCFGYGNGRFGHPEQDRAISLREAAMLQTFPAEYAFVPPDVPVRFSKLGRLIGNAVPVALGAAVGRALVQHVEAVRGAAKHARTG